MQKSGFFNAILTNGEYDRKYNANDYCDNLAVVISNGVLRGVDDDLKVTASGMVVTVGVGRAWINGHYYVNDTPHTFAAVSAPIGGARYDRVFLRLNNNLAVRSISLVYAQGTAGNSPVKPAPVREGNIYDIVLADIYVGTNATSVTVTDTRSNTDICGWVYSTSGDNSFFKSLDAAFNEWFGGVKDTLASVTLFKRYNWRTVLESLNNTVTFNIPQYDAETCFIEVYVNGMVETEGNDYTLNGNIITFKGNLIAGTEIEVKCFKSIDGTGITSVGDEITELQNAVAAIQTVNEYEYICNGVDDNVKLSQIAQAWLNGGTDSAAKIIKVYGNFGATAPYAGSGTDAAGYQWIAAGLKDHANRKITFDFSAVASMNFNCSGNAKHIIFYGADAHIIGANVQVAGNSASTNVIIFSGRVGDITADRCKFVADTTGSVTIAESGTFIDCTTWTSSSSASATNFSPATTSRPLVVFGGTHYAYCGDASNYHASVFYVATNATNAVLMAYGVNLPTVARGAFYQTNAARINAGKVYISGITTMLAISENAHIETNGHISISKA